MKKNGIIRFTTILCIGLMIIILSCQKDSAKIDDDRVVARINDFKITQKQLGDYFNKLHPRLTFSKASDSLKNIILNEMINQQLTLMEAYRLGYDKSPDVLDYLTKKERSLAGNALEEREVKNKVITEDVVKKYYKWSDRELKLLRMKFKCGPDNSEKEEKEKKAWSIYDQLLQGADFKTLAAQFSEHTNAEKDSGRMATVNCFEINEDIFSHAYELTEGEFGKPFFSYNTYYLVKVEQINYQKLGNFEKERSKIESQLQEYFSGALSHQFNLFQKKLLTDFHYELHSDNILFFCERAGTMKSRQDSASLYSDDEKLMALSSSDIGEITIGEFFPKVINYYWNSLNQKRVVDMLLVNINYDRIKKHKAMAEGLNKLPEVEQELNAWKVTMLKSWVLNKEVIEKIDVSDAVLRRIFDHEKYKLREPERRTVREIFQKTEDGINEVCKLAVKGRDFKELEAKYQQNKETRTNGIIGPFRKGPNGKLGENAFSMKVGEISKPFKYRGGYSIIKLLSVEPERMKSFEEAKEQIENKYIEENKDQFISKWYAKIADKYKIEIRQFKS